MPLFLIERSFAEELEADAERVGRILEPFTPTAPPSAARSRRGRARRSPPAARPTWPTARTASRRARPNRARWSRRTRRRWRSRSTPSPPRPPVPRTSRPGATRGPAIPTTSPTSLLPSSTCRDRRTSGSCATGRSRTALPYILRIFVHYPWCPPKGLPSARTASLSGRDGLVSFQGSLFLGRNTSLCKARWNPEVVVPHSFRSFFDPPSTGKLRDMGYIRSSQKINNFYSKLMGVPAFQYSPPPNPSVFCSWDVFGIAKQPSKIPEG